MTLEEIYRDLSAHMIKGLMVHDELANYYDFLGLDGYRCCHEYHYMMENCGYKKLNRYFVHHHNRLIPYKDVDSPDVIPDSWYRYKRDDVDNSTKMNAIKKGLMLWLDWETETKSLYQKMYKELMDIGEIADAEFIAEFIKDVDEEHTMVMKYQLNKKASDYDLVSIVEEQRKLKKKYLCKLDHLGDCWG